MTNEELREMLDEFGDHLEVKVVVPGEEEDTEYSVFFVDTRDGELAITVEG